MPHRKNLQIKDVLVWMQHITLFKHCPTLDWQVNLVMGAHTHAIAFTICKNVTLIKDPKSTQTIITSFHFPPYFLSKKGQQNEFYGSLIQRPNLVHGVGCAHIKVCGRHSIKFFNRTPIFDWCVVRWGSRNKQHKGTCSKGIGLCRQNL